MNYGEHWKGVIEREGLETFEDHLAYYKLCEAYRGDRGSDQYNPTIEGFAAHLDAIGFLTVRETVEVIPGQLEITPEPQRPGKRRF